MSKIPTATQLIRNKFPDHNGVFVLKNIEEFMIEFAKLHTEAAIRSLTSAEFDRASEKDIDVLTKRNLKHFYPLDLIK